MLYVCCKLPYELPVASGWGLKLRGTGVESLHGQILVIEALHIVIQYVQRHGVCSAACGTVHYKEPLMSFDKSRTRSPLPAVAILPCRDIAMIVQRLYSHSGVKCSKVGNLRCTKTAHKFSNCLGLYIYLKRR